MIGAKKKIPDSKVIEQLQFGDNRTVDRMLLYLHHRVYHFVLSFVKKNRGTDADSEDLFQDGLVALYRLVRSGKVSRHSTNVEAYLYTICRNIWYKQLHKRKETFELDESANSIPIEDLALYSLMDEERKTAIDEMLSRIGDSCKQLLIYYFYDRLRLSKIAELMDYASEQVAKNKKSECMKKLRSLASEIPSIKSKIS